MNAFICEANRNEEKKLDEICDERIVGEGNPVRTNPINMDLTSLKRWLLISFVWVFHMSNDNGWDGEGCGLTKEE